MKTSKMVLWLAAILLFTGCATDDSVVKHSMAVDGGKSIDATLTEIKATVASPAPAPVPMTCAELPDNAACSDISKCILHGVCLGADCSMTTNPCEDGNVCTNDACDPVIGCFHINNGAVPCTDNNVCTDGDFCTNGSCWAKGMFACDDANICTQDFCNALTGCVHTDVQSECSDEDPCTIDACETLAGGCVHTPVNCDDKSPWTEDTCTVTGGTSTICTHDGLNIVFSAALSPKGVDFNPVQYYPVIYIAGQTEQLKNVLTPFSIDNAKEWTYLLKNVCHEWPGILDGTFKVNAGYIKFENGYFKENEYSGGHLVKAQVMDYKKSPALLADLQPALLPEIGTQLYAADGSPIPQSYIAPNLKTICKKLMALE